jgi:hypothetical protein
MGVLESQNKLAYSGPSSTPHLAFKRYAQDEYLTSSFFLLIIFEFTEFKELAGRSE